jgi:hypothetical protein
MAGANKIIDTGSLWKNLMMRSIKYDVDEIMNDILSSWDWYEIYKQELSTKWIWKTFADLKTSFINTDVSVLWISSNTSETTIYYSKYIICENDAIFYVAEDKLNKI